MTEYPVSPEDQPLQSRDLFVPEHASTPASPAEQTQTETAPSAAQTPEPNAPVTTHPHVPASSLMGRIVTDGEAEKPASS